MDISRHRHPVNRAVRRRGLPTETSGLQQINLLIPNNLPAGTMQLLLQAGTVQTQAGVTITVVAPGAEIASIR